MKVALNATSRMERMNMELKYKCFSCCDKKTEQEMTRKGRVMRSLCNECSIKKSVEYKSGNSPPNKQKTKEELRDYNRNYYLKNQEKLVKRNSGITRPRRRCIYCDLFMNYNHHSRHIHLTCSTLTIWNKEYNGVMKQLKKTIMKIK